MQENIVEPDRQPTTTEKMRLECRITRQEYRYIPIIFNTFLLLGNSGYANARTWYIMRTLPVTVPQTSKNDVQRHSLTQRTCGMDAVTCTVARGSQCFFYFLLTSADV